MGLEDDLKIPSTAREHAAHAKDLEEQERLQEAANEYEAAILIAPLFFSAIKELAKVYLCQKRWSDALVTFNRVRDEFLDDPILHWSMGFCEDELGNHSTAAYHYGNAAHLWPDYAPLHFNMGNAFMRAGPKYQEDAIKSYKRLLELDPCHTEAQHNLDVLNDVNYHVIRGGNLLEQKRFHEASEEYKVAVQIDSECTVAWRDLAMCYVNLKQWQNAIVALYHVIEVHGDDPNLYWVMGGCYDKLGDHESAGYKYWKAAKLRPENITYHFDMGNAFLLAGSEWREEAIIAYKRVLEIDPCHEDAQHNLDIADPNNIYHDE